MGIDNLDDDSALLARVRHDADAEAFASLYRRHHPSARRFARSLCRNETDADDLTAQVFTNLFVTLRGGRGPTDLALPYLIASIKHAHYRVARRRAMEDAALVPGDLAGGRDPADCVEIEVLRSAFATLPANVRSLLWRSEVEDETVQDLASSGRVSTHALAVQTHRARRALGTAYLAQHAEPEGGIADVEPECRLALDDLAALVRGRLGMRRRRQLERHLSKCARCGTARRRLVAVNARLRMHPRLPWELATSGIGAAVRAQVSTWIAASTVTLAGASAVAIAVVSPSSPFTHEAAAASAPATVLHHESTTTTTGSIPTGPAGPGGRDDGSPHGFVGSQPPDVGPARALAVGPMETASTGSLTTPIVDATTSVPHVTVSGVVAIPPAPGPDRPADRPAETAPRGEPAAGSDGDAPTSIDDASTVDETHDRGTDDDDADGQGSGNANGPGNGNANGQGNGNANGQGNGNANGQGNGNANGQGNGNANGQGNGNANGQGNGNANGQGNGNANGQGNGNANGPANRNANGQGNANGHGDGNANANGQGNGHANGKHGEADDATDGSASGDAQAAVSSGDTPPEAAP